MAGTFRPDDIGPAGPVMAGASAGKGIVRPGAYIPANFTEHPAAKSLAKSGTMATGAMGAAAAITGLIMSLLGGVIPSAYLIPAGFVVGLLVTAALMYLRRSNAALADLIIQLASMQAEKEDTK